MIGKESVLHIKPGQAQVFFFMRFIFIFIFVVCVL